MGNADLIWRRKCVLIHKCDQEQRQHNRDKRERIISLGFTTVNYLV